MDDPSAQSASLLGDIGLLYAKFGDQSASSALHSDGACESSVRRATYVQRRPSLCSIGTTRKSDTRLPPSYRERQFAKRSLERSRKCQSAILPRVCKAREERHFKMISSFPQIAAAILLSREVRDLGAGSPIGSSSCVGLTTTRSFRVRRNVRLR